MPEQIGDEKIYTVREVAKIIDRSTVMVSKLINAGKIDAIMIGRQFIIAHDDLVSYLDDIKLPESVIDLRLGVRSPKTGAIINKKNPVA